MREFKELNDIIEISSQNDPLISSKELATINDGKKDYPILGMTIGTQRKDVPTFGLFAGVHGLERVGTHVVTTFLQNLLNRLKWDMELRAEFENFRLVTIPLINPAGMDHIKRSNLNGVDLMRNCPIELDDPSTGKPLLSGHRISPKLPWYRGADEKVLEVETKAVIDFIDEQMLQSPFCMSLDVHSGFGMKDRLWHPYAKSKDDFHYMKEVDEFKNLLNLTLPHHIYIVEQQSESYTTHGDLWDYIFERNELNQNKKGVIIPWTLELGSWLWVKKNPIQAFSVLGFFNPVREHRFERVMRRHLLLLDFMIQATKNYKQWMEKEETTQENAL